MVWCWWCGGFGGVVVWCGLVVWCWWCGVVVRYGGSVGGVVVRFSGVVLVV